MAVGRKKNESQNDLFITHDRLPKSEGHVFYVKLNQLLAEAEFDPFVEELCEPYYCKGGRPGIPPGTYFRMLMVGYFEGLGSQRGIAWRCEDSLSLRKFLGLALTEDSPDHSSLTRIRDRLPSEVHVAVFDFILKIADERNLLGGKTVAVDSSTIEADAAMRSIVRRETGEDYKTFVKGLMKEEIAAEEGVEIEDVDEPGDEEMRRFDRKRKGKTLSNEEWKSSTDASARIAKMKDGRTRLAYKVEHVVDMESDLLLSAEVQHADQSDANALADAVFAARERLNSIGCCEDRHIEEVAADKGYHAAEQIELCESLNVRTYVPEPERKRKLSKLSEAERKAILNNRARMRRDKGKELGRLRSEQVERSFAHMLETGGARRSWLRGVEKIQKRYWIVAAGRNVGVLMRSMFGVGKPRVLQRGLDGFLCAIFGPNSAATRLLRSFSSDRSVIGGRNSIRWSVSV